MRSYLYLLLTWTLLSCSTTKNNQAQDEDRRLSYTHEYTKFNVLPDFSRVTLPKRSAQRAPASAGQFESTDPKLKNFSNKKIYFMALVDQYYQLSRYTSQATPINSCSNFHTEYLKYKTENSSPSFVSSPWDKSVLKSIDLKENMGFFPELFLSLNPKEQSPIVAQYIPELGPQKRVSLLKRAYHIHVGKVHSEIMDLCETGTSSNYYLFENFVTYMKSSPQFQYSEKALKSLLKLSVFSNILIKKSIQAMAIAHKQTNKLPSYSTFEREVFFRLSANWSMQRWDSLMQKRVELENMAQTYSKNFKY